MAEFVGVVADIPGRTSSSAAYEPLRLFSEFADEV
jgi:hypothetical protein